jgi:hypothetical protein
MLSVLPKQGNAHPNCGVNSGIRLPLDQIWKDLNDASTVPTFKDCLTGILRASN